MDNFARQEVDLSCQFVSIWSICKVKRFFLTLLVCMHINYVFMKQFYGYLLLPVRFFVACWCGSIVISFSKVVSVSNFYFAKKI